VRATYLKVITFPSKNLLSGDKSVYFLPKPKTLFIPTMPHALLKVGSGTVSRTGGSSSGISVFFLSAPSNLKQKLRGKIVKDLEGHLEYIKEFDTGTADSQVTLGVVIPLHILLDMFEELGWKIRHLSESNEIASYVFALE
jgi:hypothetical protein